MTEVQEIGIEIGSQRTLIKALFGDSRITELVSFKFDSNAPTDGEYTTDELNEVLNHFTLAQAREIFQTLNEHSRIKDRAGTARGIHSYFYNFVEALEELATQVITTGSTDKDQILAALFPIEAAPEKTIKPVLISPVADLTARIEALINKGQIDLAAARETVYGHEGIKAFPGAKLRDIIQSVADNIEIIVDEHTQSLDAIYDYVHSNKAIPEALLAYMKSKVPGGTTVGSYTTDKIAHLYLTTQTDQKQYRKEIQLLSNRDHKQNGKSPEGQVAKTSAEHLQDCLSVLESKRSSGQMVLAARDFPSSYKNFLNKNYETLVGLEARVRAHLTSQGKSELLQRFTFENQSNVSQLSIDEIKAGKAALERVLVSIQAAEDKQFGPSDLDDIPELHFLRGKRARVTGSSFPDRVKNFAEHTEQTSLLKGISILSTDEDTIRTTNKKHLATLKKLIEGNAIHRASDIPEAVVGHFDRHYQHLAQTTKARALLFLSNLGRDDLAEKLNQMIK